MNQFIKRLLDTMSRYSDEVALKDATIEITYKELEVYSAALADKILTITNGGIELPIAIYMERSVSFVISMIAVLRSGCYYIPIEKPYPNERMEYLLNESNCHLMLVDDSYTDVHFNISKKIEIINCNDFDTRKAKKIQHNRFPTTTLDNLCYTIYTSGSTGVPKGVSIQYDSLLHLIDELYKLIYINIKTSVNIAVVASFSFDASVKQIFCSLLFGHSLVIVEKSAKYFGRKLVNFFNQNNIYITDITPTLLRNIVLQNKESIKLSLKVLLIGGEMLFWEDIKNLTQKLTYIPVIINLYGPTECCVDVTAFLIDPEKINLSSGIVPVGKPLEDIQIKILRKDGNEADLYEEGELVIYGICVARGYLNTRKSNAFGVDSKLNIRYYRTGDIGYRDKNDLIYIKGRNDDQIKLYGNRMNILEIEIAIKKIQYIKECKVLLYKNRLYCFFVCENQMKVDIVNELKNLLPIYMIPRQGLLLDKLPINKNGKIDNSILVSYIKNGKTNILKG